MKKNLFLLAAILLASPAAYAYDSASGLDPNVQVPNGAAGEASTGYASQGGYDFESKSVVRSTVAGSNDAIAAGNALFYSEGTGEIARGLEVVSLESAETQGAQAAVSYQACIAPQAVATGFNAAFRCVVRGYYPAALYATGAGGISIAKGQDLCVGSQATSFDILVPCASGVVSNFKALEAKSAGTSGTIKVRVNSN